MSRYAMRRGINTAHRQTLFSSYLEKMQNVPRGTKHEVIDSPQKSPDLSVGANDNSKLPSK